MGRAGGIMGSGLLGPLAPLLTIAAFLCVPVYPVAQVWVLLRRSGPAFWLSVVPIAPMGILLGVTVHGFMTGSNLAPLLLILASPVAVLWLWLAGFLRGGD